jgi:CRP-like cAMP-binding protein
MCEAAQAVRQFSGIIAHGPQRRGIQMDGVAGGEQEPAAGRPARQSGPQELTDLPFFRSLPREVAQRHAGAARWITAEPDQQLLDFEDRSDDVFFVLSGCVRVTLRTPGGRELILDDIEAGGFFGEMAAIDGAPRSAAVTALHRSRICRIGAAAFLAILADSPALSREMMRILVARIRAQNARIFELTALDIRHRLYAELLRQAGPPGPDGARSISPPPVQSILAQRIGARREPVSREIAKLLRDGVAERRRGALVLRRPKLLEAALAEVLEE